MASKEKFLNTPLDRTPYGSCVSVALVVILFFCIGASLLWQAATYTKQHHLFQIPHFGAPHLAAPSDTQLLQQVQDATNRSKQQLEDKAQQELKSQVQQQTDSLKQGATNNLKTYLNQ